MRISVIVGLTDALDLAIVAEGIETTAQEDSLSRLGCRYGQGYLWNRPIPLADMTRLIQHQQPDSRTVHTV